MNNLKNNFIDKAKLKHGDKYDYSLVKYKNNKTKVKIICNKENIIFEQTPDNHLVTSGCQDCAFNNAHERNKSNANEFIKKAKKKHGELYDYTKVEYYNAKTNVIIICKKDGHGEFHKRPDNHLSGQGCTKCALEIKKGKKIIYNRIPHNKYTLDQFIKKANTVHQNTYNYSKTEYINTKKNVIIICPVHGEFQQIAGSHLQGSGCNKCAIIKSHNLQRKSQEQFITDAIKIHGNDKYDYNKVKYVSNRIKVTINCKIHGDFDQLPWNHLKYGCSDCSNDALKLTLSEFIEKSNIVHNNKYEYKNSKYINTRSNITITCKKHGDFEQIANTHLRGKGCTKCVSCPKCQLWKTNGVLCVYCKPLKQNKLYQKTKEIAVVKFLKDNLPNNEFIHNKSVGKDCTDGHLFPDILFDCDYYNLIVEIDEHKHRGADYKCDEKRMYDIIAKLGLPCIFIRYNPDNKKSDKNILLNSVKKYLELKSNDDIVWDDYGFKVEYLFY